VEREWGQTAQKQARAKRSFSPTLAPRQQTGIGKGDVELLWMLTSIQRSNATRYKSCINDTSTRKTLQVASVLVRLQRSTRMIRDFKTISRTLAFF